MVTALEETLLGAAPTFEEYLQAVRARSSKSAGGSTGLTYALMKHWPEDIHRLMYDLLAVMWDAKMIADRWQFRWLVTIPKQPDQPSLQAMLDRYDYYQDNESDREKQRTVLCSTWLAPAEKHCFSQLDIQKRLGIDMGV